MVPSPYIPEATSCKGHCPYWPPPDPHYGYYAGPYPHLPETPSYYTRYHRVPQTHSSGPTTPAYEPPPCCNLYVMNLPPSYNTQKVAALFSPFGPLFSTVLFKSRGTACIQFHHLSNAAQALRALNGFQVTPQRMLLVRYANRTYTPQHRPTQCSNTSSETESTGHSGHSESERGSAEDPSEVDPTKE